MSASLIWNTDKFLQNPYQFYSQKNQPKIYKAVNPFLTQDLSQYHKSGSTFSKMSLLLLVTTAAH